MKTEQEMLDKTLKDAMTVEDLIDWLIFQDPKSKVVIHYPSGDYWHNEIAKPITGIDEMEVEYSAYHKNLKIPNDFSENNEPTEFVTVIG